MSFSKFVGCAVFVKIQEQEIVDFWDKAKGHVSDKMLIVGKIKASVIQKSSGAKPEFKLPIHSEFNI